MNCKKGFLSEPAVFCTSMYLAAQFGHKDVVEYLSELPMTLKTNEMLQFTALYLAAMKGNLNIIKYLNENDVEFTDDIDEDVVTYLQEEVDDNSDDELDDGENICNSIFDAAKKGNRRDLKLFLDVGVHIDTCDENSNTALQLAVENGNVNAVKFLMKNGANFACKNKHINTPLHLAAKTGSTELVQMFLTKGIPINIQNYLGYSPLHFAAEEGHTAVIDLLLQNGASVGEKNSNGDCPLHLAPNELVTEALLKNPVCINMKNNNGDTPLHIAVQRGLKHVVKSLLKHGANVFAKNNSNEAVIDKTNNELIIILLLQNGLNINVKKEGNLLLHYAATWNMPNLTEFLVTHEMDIEVSNENNETPLFLSAANGYSDVVKILLKYGANIHSRTSRMYKFSIGAFYKLNSKFNSLHIASFNGHYEVVKILLQNGADVNSVCEHNGTALMMAARNGHTQVVKFLILNGAKKDLKSNVPKKLLFRNLRFVKSESLTALEYATFFGHKEILIILNVSF